MREDLVDIISLVDKRSFSILYTSGQGLTLEKAQALKEAGLFMLAVSLDHHDEATCDRLRGRQGAFRTALEAVKFSRQAGLFTMIQSTVTKDMIINGDVGKLIKLAEEVKAHTIRILDVMPTGKVLEMDESKRITAKEREALIQIQKDHMWSWSNLKVEVLAYTESPALLGCWAGNLNVYVDSAGNVCPCDFVPLSFGNIKTRPFMEIWREMCEATGSPRQGCIIQEHYKEISKYSNGRLPLGREASLKVCMGCKDGGGLPGMFETGLGNK